MSETPRTDELKRGIWRLMQSQEREQAYAWRDAIHCGIEQLERALTAERERADRLIAFLADDALAITYQSLDQYRQAAIDAARRK